MLQVRDAQLWALEGEGVREKIIAVYNPTVYKAKTYLGMYSDLDIAWSKKLEQRWDWEPRAEYISLMMAELSFGNSSAFSFLYLLSRWRDGISCQHPMNSLLGEDFLLSNGLPIFKL